MVTVDYLKEKFEVKEDRELAAIFSRSPGAVAQWRTKGSVPARIQLIARDLGVSEPETPYRKNEAVELPLDEIEKIIIQKMKKRGKAYQFKWLAEIEAEEEAELKNNPAP